MDQLENLFREVRSTVRRLENEKKALEMQLQDQKSYYEKEIMVLKRQIQANVNMKSPELRINTKKRKKHTIKQENSPRIEVKNEVPFLENLKEPLQLNPISSSVMSSPVQLSNSNKVPISSSSPTKILNLSYPAISPIRYHPHSRQVSPVRLSDSEFARLPTQYSDSCSEQSQKPQSMNARAISPEIIEGDFNETGKEQHLKKDILGLLHEASIVESDNNGDDDDDDDDDDNNNNNNNNNNNMNMNNDEMNNDDKMKNRQDFDFIDYSEDEGIIRAPLQNISNISRPENSQKMTILQKRDHKREQLIEAFHKDPQYKINLKQNPIYEQRWLLTDFKPNPNYIKPKLKRKIGKTNKEQLEIDRFYKLAGPAIHLKSLKWNYDEENGIVEDEDENDNDNDNMVKVSQLYDRFPSPPGFNEVDFPTTQEELERKKYVEQLQNDRIKCRLKECIKLSIGKPGTHIFREEILNQFIRENRFYTN